MRNLRMLLVVVIVLVLSACSPGALPEVVEARFEASGDEGRAPFTVEFAASSLQGMPAGEVVYRWDFGDGVTAEGQTVSHTYTRAGEFAARLEVSSPGSSGRGQHSSTLPITVLPGPLAAVQLGPERPAVLTGDSIWLSLAASDEFGNPIPTQKAAWQAEPGEMHGDTAGAFFRAGRDPGDVLITVTADDGEASVTEELMIRVEPGYCRTERRHAEWEVQWLPAAGSGPLVTTSEPGAMTLDGTPKPADGAGRIRASMDVVVQRSGPVRLGIDVEGEVRLLVNGTEVISGTGEVGKLVDLAPGFHRLELEYMWTGSPKLVFEADGDVLEWDAALECTGGYVPRPGQRYLLLEPGLVETAGGPGGVADRFGVPEQHLVTDRAGVLVPGGVGPRDTLIVLHGLGSWSACSESASREHERSIIHAVQTEAWRETGRVSGADLITFSYGGGYVDCDTGEAVALGNAAGRMADGIRAFYEPVDTCAGVEAASVRLRELVDEIRSRDPDARVHLAGHSMGGMVAAYYLASEAGAPDESRIGAVITLDSPLDGYRGPEISLACSQDSPSRRDIRAVTPVVPAIAGLRQSPWAERMLAINSTFVGQAAGTQVVTVNCGTDLPDSDDLVAWLLAFANLVSDFIVAHNCGFTHPDSLAAIAAAINGERAAAT